MVTRDVVKPMDKKYNQLEYESVDFPKISTSAYRCSELIPWYVKRQSNTLAPLTKIMSIKIKIKWTKVEQDTFDEIKCIVACNPILACP